MTTYRNIHGRSIQSLATDPTESVAEGQIWYNTTSDTFKSILSSEAWASGGALATARANLAGAGIQTAALAFGGATPSLTTATEEYNGSGWTSGGDLGTARYKLAGAGTQTAGLAIGGGVPPSNTASGLTEEYGGTSWTAGNALGTARKELAGCGTQTAGLAFGGKTTTLTNATEEYDGSSWTAGNNLGANKYLLAGAGIQTAGLAFGGYSGTTLNATEEYDGSSWTAGNNMGTAQYQLGGAGIQTSALGFGGSVGPRTQQTELYDGTNWSTGPNLATGRNVLGGAGANNTAALAFGGQVAGPAVTSVTEEFTKSATVFTPSAWAAGGAMPVAKRVGGCSKGGSINSSLTFGGDTLPMGAGQPQVNTTELYDGSAWTGGGVLANNLSGSAGAGTQTAMIGATGYSFPTPWGTAGASYIANAFEYDGSSWTNVTAYPTTGVGMISLGTQTAALFGGGAQGGSPGPEANEKSKDYKEYDGSSWTTGGATNVFHSRTQSSAGTQTAGIVYAGGDAPGGNPSGRGDTVEEYNGTAWTSAITAPKENTHGGGFGTQTAFLVTNGTYAPIPSSPGTTGYSFTTLVYDGTTMRTDANTATRRVYLGADGSIGTAAGMVCGGSTSYSSRTAATEEYSQGSSAINVKTLTQS